MATKKEYKSPKYKLVEYFEQSRDTWRTKATTGRLEIKNLNHKLNYHKDKHAMYKNRCKELERELQELKKKIKPPSQT